MKDTKEENIQDIDTEERVTVIEVTVEEEQIPVVIVETVPVKEEDKNNE